MDSYRRLRCWGDSKTKVQPKWTRGVWSRNTGDVGQWVAQPARLVVVGGGGHHLTAFKKKIQKTNEFPTSTFGILNVLVQNFLKTLL